MVLLGALMLPLAWLGSAPAAHAQTAGGTGFVEICKEWVPGVSGVFDFTIEGRPTHYFVAPGTCTPPISVPAGNDTIRENNLPEDLMLVAAETSPAGRLVDVDPAQSTVTVNVTGGNPPIEVVVTVKDVPAGWIEICKQGDGYLSGTFPVRYTSRYYPWVTGTVNVLVDACTAPIKVPAGPVDLAEQQIPGTRLIDVQAKFPGDGRVEIPFSSAGEFSVDVPRGDASAEVLLTLHNEMIPSVKICKIAGENVPVGTEFWFDIIDQTTDDVESVSVPAGPDPGFCELVDLPAFDHVGDPMVVAENLAGPTPLLGGRWAVPTVTSNLANALFGPDDSGAVKFNLEGGINLLTFKNSIIRALKPTTQIKICAVAGSGVADGTPFTFALSAQGRQTTQVVVPAGKADGGYCEFAAADTYRVDDQVMITEQAQDGFKTMTITVLPADRQAGPPNLPGRSIVITAGDGVTTVSFTNTQ